MSRLQLVEETAERLVLRQGILAMVGQFGLCMLAVSVACFSLVLFLQSYLGSLSYILVGLPGLTCVACGCIGCLNARKHTFIFDKVGGQFTVNAGSMSLSRPLNQVVVVHVERERSSTSSSSGGGVAVGGPNTFAAALLFTDGHRYRLEGGASVSGSGAVPPQHLQAQADRIRDFLQLPQPRVALLDVTRHVAERKLDERQAHIWLNRYLSCRALEPQLEAPLAEYDWVDPPLNVEVPRARRSYTSAASGNGRNFAAEIMAQAHAEVHAAQGVPPVQVVAVTAVPATSAGQQQQLPVAQATYIGTSTAAGGVAAAVPSRTLPEMGAVVMGRPVGQQAPPPRVLRLVVREGLPGRTVRLTSPNGVQVQAAVPRDMQPGQTMTIQY